jgi:hypothetical protein
MAGFDPDCVETQCASGGVWESRGRSAVFEKFVFLGGLGESDVFPAVSSCRPANRCPGGRFYAAMAAVKSLIPMIFITRVKL